MRGLGQWFIGVLVLFGVALWWPAAAGVCGLVTLGWTLLCLIGAIFGLSPGLALSAVLVGAIFGSLDRR